MLLLIFYKYDVLFIRKKSNFNILTDVCILLYIYYVSLAKILYDTNCNYFNYPPGTCTTGDEFAMHQLYIELSTSHRLSLYPR